MPRAREVRLTNGDEEAFVLEESVKAYERHGWTRADDGDREQDSETVPQPAEKKTTRKAD